MTAGLKTTYERPCALVLWGPKTPNKQPSTRLAFIQEYDAATDRYMAVTFNGRLEQTKHSRWFEGVDILQTWKIWPSQSAIQRVKRSLPICESS